MKNVLITFSAIAALLLVAGAVYKFKQPDSQRYQLMADSANHVWKLDTTTGQMWYCSVAPGVIYRDINFIDCSEPDGPTLASH